MATYALTFATRAAFDTSLASGDIYNLMQGVTSSKPSVAITATITESGETFACGTNVMVDIKSVGPGDRVMYESSSEDDPANQVFKGRFFGIANKWIDNNYPAQPTQHIMIFKTGVLPARYVDGGVCVRRFGNRIRVAGESSSLPWSSTSSSDYQWDVPTIQMFTTIVKKSRTTTTAINENSRVAFMSQRYQEAMYPTGNAAYVPILRSAWDAAVNDGDATVSGNGKTVTMADYGNSFDKFLAYHYAPLYPAADGVYVDTDGMANTAKIVSEFVASHGKTTASVDYAAGYCYNYTKSAPGLGKRQWFLGTMRENADVCAIRHALPIPYAWNSGFFSSSSIYSYSSIWGLSLVGNTVNYPKNTALGALPLADLILEN